MAQELKLHCHLTDRDVMVSVSGGSALMALRLDPYVYQSGFVCSKADQCRDKSIRCQVYEDLGQFPFDDPDMLDVHSTIQNYREHLIARAAAFSGMGAKYIKRKASRMDSASSKERLEIAYMLRFYSGHIQEVWPALKLFFEPERIRREPAAAAEAYYSLGYWIEKKIVPGAIRSDVIRALIGMKKAVAEFVNPDDDMRVIRESIDAMMDALHRV